MGRKVEIPNTRKKRVQNYKKDFIYASARGNFQLKKQKLLFLFAVFFVGVSNIRNLL